MLEWFSRNSIWILSGASLVLSVVLLCREGLKKKAAKSFSPKAAALLDKILPVVFWVVCSLLLAVIAAAVVAIVLSEEGASASITSESVQEWLLEHGMLVLLIIVISSLLYRVACLAVPKLVERYIRMRAKSRHSKLWYENRTRTLSSVIVTTTGGAILIIAIFMLLGELNINIAPLLAGAGVLGVAIGFGAQSLIKDFLSGLFVFLEDQYNKGDVVEVAGRIGTVEELNLRRTVLRDLDGIVHSIPNGEITTSSNYTRDWSRVKLDVPVGYGEDLDRVFEILNRVGMELAADKIFGPKIKTPPQVLRVQDFGASAIEIRMLGDVKPIEQWTVTGELRKRVKKAFDDEGVEIPWPHVKLYLGKETGKKSLPLLCTQCSVPNPAANRFCTNCGKELAPPAG